MSDSEKQRRRELECMRLASDLIQLANATLNPELKAQCRRSAEMWADEGGRESCAVAIPKTSPH